MADKTLKLVLKSVWFNKIKQGLKTHEYREYKDYWISRLKNPEEVKFVELQNGYRANPEKMLFTVTGICVTDGQNTDLQTKNKVFDIVLGRRIS
jgi:hypothetical protein